jgi:hypothetical protein
MSESGQKCPKRLRLPAGKSADEHMGGTVIATLQFLSQSDKQGFLGETRSGRRRGRMCPCWKFKLGHIDDAVCSRLGGPQRPLVGFFRNILKFAAKNSSTAYSSA